MRNRILRRVAMLLVSIGLGAGAALVAAQPASAYTHSYVWQTNANGWVAIYSAPNVNTIPDHWSKSGTTFDMYCWLDNAGERWFWGQIYDTGGWKYVRAVQVYNQISVGHC